MIFHCHHNALILSSQRQWEHSHFAKFVGCLPAEPCSPIPPLVPNSRIFQYLLSTSPRVDSNTGIYYLPPPPGHLEKISTIYPGGGRGGGPARLEFFGFFCPNLQKNLAFLLVCTMAPCCPRAPQTSTIYVWGGR